MEEKNEKLDIKSMNIYEKMNLITNEIGLVIKNQTVKVSKDRSYKAVKEKDILDAVKPLENKYRVYSYPVDRTVIEKDIVTKETDYGTSTSFYMRLEIVYRFVNIDKPEEFIEIKTYGDGLDTGDKAPGKAMTYGDKYALMKAYKISTGDDSDKNPSPQQGYKKAMTLPDEEQIKLKIQFDEMIIKTETDLPTVLNTYGVKDSTQLSKKQLIQAINHMAKKIKKEDNEVF